jgi:hypothetical protein
VLATASASSIAASAIKENGGDLSIAAAVFPLK